MRRINLLHAHGSPTHHQYSLHGCRCVLCCGEKAQHSAAYIATHREERAAYRVAHREEIAANQAAYDAAHREEIAAHKAEYRLAHREEQRAGLHNSRARRRAATGTHTAADVATQYLRQHGRCYWCDARVGKTYHVDHVMPVILGGSNGPENLVISCPTCNLSKGGKHPMDFAERLC